MRYYAHQVVLLKKLNSLAMEDGLECSHLCHIKNCINPEHIVAEPRHINNNRLHCSGERRDHGDLSYCTGHEPYPRCISGN